MSLYLNQIAQLVALQKIDNAIYDVEKKLKKAPEEIESLEERFVEYNTQKLHIEEKLAHLVEQEKRISAEVEGSIANIKKSKAKLSQVENEKEFSAMSREMDNMEKQNKYREDEQQALVGELELQNTLHAEILETWKEVDEQLKEAKTELESFIAESQKELDELKVARKESLVDVPHPVLVRYEFIRRRLKHPVIVNVKGGICSGCNISIPPQIYNELQRGQQIVSCPNCQRLVYWSEHFNDGTQENAEQAEASVEE